MGMGIGRLLITLGAVLMLIGVLISILPRLPIPFGKLPGDFVFRGKNWVFYFPLGTSILLSILLTLVFWLLARR